MFYYAFIKKWIHFTRTSTTITPAIQKAGEVRTRVAKPPDGVDEDPRSVDPPLPPPPKKSPRTPDPEPTNEVSRLIIYTIASYIFYLRKSSSKTTAPAAHVAGDCVISANDIDDVPPPST